jgi:dihydrofolate synthase/folylpolyglutamate synthase
LAEVNWPARLEVIRRRPLIVLDCAHNVASALALVQTLQASFPATRRLLVFAGSNDKDLVGIFRVLTPHFDHAFLTRFADNPRSVAPEQLASLLARAGELPCTSYPSAEEALVAALAAAAPEDLVCITGSVFLAGELRPRLLAL